MRPEPGHEVPARAFDAVDDRKPPAAALGDVADAIVSSQYEA